MRGQGLVETALFFPVLLLVLSSLVEFGFLLNDYLAMQDAARNAARFASDGLYYESDTDMNCNTTRNFYRQTACLVNRELSQARPQLQLDLGNGHDDIVISTFSVTQGSGISARHSGEAGWSEALDSTGTRNQSSRLSQGAVNGKLDSLAPSTGFLSVEIFYDYHQKLGLPWVTAILRDPFLLHAYVFMPLVSAEPTATPIP
jgi:hypothetical protein